MAKCISGEDLERLSDEELVGHGGPSQCSHASTPQQKLRIVTALKDE